MCLKFRAAFNGIFINFRNFNDFYVRKSSVREAHTYVIGTFCFFLSRELSHAPAFRLFQHFNDFYLHRASAREAHLLNWHDFLWLHSTNRAWYFSKPKLRRSNCYEALFIVPKSRFPSIFAISMIFVCIECVCKTHLPILYDLVYSTSICFRCKIFR